MRVRWARLVLVLVTVAVAALGLARATAPDRPRTQQEQVDAIAATIRCPTCQGLSIKDSSSVLAAGARQIVADQVRAGRSPAQIRQYFVDRYGDFVLLSPRASGPGLVVWLLPLLLLGLAGGYGWRHLRRRDGPVAATTGVPAAIEADGDAAAALAAYRTGELEPDGSPAGELLREALEVRIAAEADGLDDDATARAEQRLGAAYRRYLRRVPVAARSRLPLPRRAVAAVAVVLLLAGTAAALAVGTRSRGASDLPTGDLPAAAAAPGLSDLLTAVERQPSDVSAWVALGRAYQAGGDWLRSLRAFDRALALEPTADDIAFLRAEVLMSAGSTQEALPILTRLAARHPRDPATVLLLGLAQNKAGRPEAVATLRRYLVLAPNAPATEMVRAVLAGR